MDNIVIWVAIIGVIGTLIAGLGGVYLGNWLQSRNIKRQRDWMLQDQKREWVRKQKQDKFERILSLVEGTLQFMTKTKFLLKLNCLEDVKEAKEVGLTYLDEGTRLMAMGNMIKDVDKKLADLTLEFCQILAGSQDFIHSNDFEMNGKEYHRLSNLAGLIRRRIDELLEETFD